MVKIGGERIFTVLELNFRLLLIGIGRRFVTATAFTFFVVVLVLGAQRHYDYTCSLRHMLLVSVVVFVDEFARVQIYRKVCDVGARRERLDLYCPSQAHTSFHPLIDFNRLVVVVLQILFPLSFVFLRELRLLLRRPAVPVRISSSSSYAWLSARPGPRRH